MNNKKDLKNAMNGIDTVYFICPAANPNKDKMGEKIINIAKEENNSCLTWLSINFYKKVDMEEVKIYSSNTVVTDATAPDWKVSSTFTFGSACDFLM